MAQEMEAKIKVASLLPLRARLEELGATREGIYRERNWVWDDAGESLRRDGKLLRLRSLGDAGGIFTVKAPVEGGEFKTREEVETMVDSAEEFMAQLKLLGYRVQWIYDKHREMWLWHEAMVALDSLPELGLFVEIEGKGKAIRDVCSHLGLDPADHIKDGYLGLWERHLAEKGEPRRNMVFAGYGTSEPGLELSELEALVEEGNKEK